MKHSLLTLIAGLLLFGCGNSGDTQPIADEATEQDVTVETLSNKDVPDPCSLLTMEEASLLGGQVDAPEENEIAYDHIRKCTWDASGEGFYGVIVQVSRAGLEEAKELMIGEAADLNDLPTAGFFEMIMGGVAALVVQKDDYTVYVGPIWTDRPPVDSERTKKLREVAMAAVGRL